MLCLMMHDRPHFSHPGHLGGGLLLIIVARCRPMDRRHMTTHANPPLHRLGLVHVASWLMLGWFVTYGVCLLSARDDRR